MSVSRRYARAFGIGLLMIVFGAGLATGRFMPRTPSQLRMIVTATDQVPAELERLGLSDEQRRALLVVLRRGRDRVIRVADQFEAPMRAAVDSTDTEIRALLKEHQRAAFDSARLANPQLRRRIIRPPTRGESGAPTP